MLRRLAPHSSFAGAAAAGAASPSTADGISNNSNKTGSSSSLMITPMRRNGLAVHSVKQDVVLGPFKFEDEYMNYRNLSRRMPDYNIAQYRAQYWRLDEYVRRAQAHMEKQGYFYLPTLDYAVHRGVLPLFSPEQLRIQYTRTHKGHIDKLNSLIVGTPLAGRPLDDVIVATRHEPALQGVYNNAAQHFNLSFFWKSLVPHGSNIPPDLLRAVEAQYGSQEAFEKAFVDVAAGLFGSGWVFWVWDESISRFDIHSYSNAGTPLGQQGITPLLAVNVWEGAYYVDYENVRPNYLARYFAAVDWDWAERHWKRATGQDYHEITWT